MFLRINSRPAAAVPGHRQTREDLPYSRTKMRWKTTRTRRWAPWPGLALAALLASAAPATAQSGPNSFVPPNPENAMLEAEINAEDEARAMARILQLVDLQAVLSRQELIPPSIVIQRDIIPALIDNQSGRALMLKRGQSVPLHDASLHGIIIPVKLRLAINTRPMQHQGRFDPLAIRKLTRNLKQGFGLVPINATDLLYQLREHIATPSYVRLTEHAPATLTRKGQEMGEIELRRNRELPLLEIQGNALRLQVYNSEVEVPIEWTDFADRQAELNRLLDQLRPVPTSPVAFTAEPKMVKPRSQTGSANIPWLGSDSEDHLTDLQIEIMERQQKLMLQMKEDDRDLAKIEAKLRLIVLQFNKLNTPPPAKSNPNAVQPTQLKAIEKQKRLEMLAKQYRQAVLELVTAYRDAATTRLKARRAFGARSYLLKARQEIQKHSKNATLTSLGLEQIAAAEEELQTFLAGYEQRKRDVALLAREDILLGTTAREAILRDYPDLPAAEQEELDRILTEAEWQSEREALRQRLAPILKLGRTDEGAALARLEALRVGLSPRNPGLRPYLERELLLARREIRQFHVGSPLPPPDGAGADSPVLNLADSLLPKPPAIPQEADTIWLRIALLAGLVISVALIGGALVFVLKPKVPGEDVRQIAKAIPPPPGQEEEGPRPTSRI